MRIRVLKVVVAFSETTDAIAAEDCFQKAKIPGRMIPLPGSISAGCGLAFAAPLEEKEALETLIRNKGIKAQGIYEIQLFERK